MNSNEKEEQDLSQSQQSIERPNILQVIWIFWFKIKWSKNNWYLNLKIIELFSSFVDAHFTHITLSNKAQEIIADVLQLIESQVRFDFVKNKKLNFKKL